ncbi:hypothetical protein A3J61_00635 [Candidatus Nomurabacteria bacterium RIFCSPHIGHO2_02_FULL_38_15]|uniref:Uncharacterized protein n=1 Tax=Candidatus Nomurabacteria bacterium RIFCSPHIGHO2_02_FULL_38_15 TaxID=1801752 RepID=A0A1F6VT69_9BACT|nr:MAG: hypothetical protein A3J61_00635 [Candidatus Nomurabacteria bacterium RIFCSPHIGHO2_02_FULL_38_15]
MEGQNLSNSNESLKTNIIKASRLNQDVWGNILRIYGEVSGASPMKLDWHKDFSKVKESLDNSGAVAYRLGSKISTHSKLRLDWEMDDKDGEKIFKVSFFGNVPSDKEQESEVLRNEFAQKVGEYIGSLT